MGISIAYISYGYINSIHFLWVYQQHTFLMGISIAYISYGYIKSIHFLWVYQQHTFLMGISTAYISYGYINSRLGGCWYLPRFWSVAAGTLVLPQVALDLGFNRPIGASYTADWSIPWQRSCDMSEWVRFFSAVWFVTRQSDLQGFYWYVFEVLVLVFQARLFGTMTALR